MRLTALLLLLLLAACGTAGTPGTSTGTGTGTGSSADPASPTSEVAAPVPGPDQELRGQGLIVDDGDGAGPRVCFGFVEESAPPQCDGLALAGWDPTDPAVSETWTRSGAAGWGQFAVTGTWADEVFTLASTPIPLALYDPVPVAPPSGSPDLPPSGLTEAELSGVQAGLYDLLPGLVAAYVEDGRVVAEVLYDDMTLQTVADREHGEGVVVVRSLLQPTGPVLE